MKTLKLTIPLALLCAITLSCCKNKEYPCDKPQTYYVLFDDFAKSKVPYTGTDTLTFASDKGDTVVFAGKGMQNDWYYERDGNAPDCPPDMNAYEMYWMDYSVLRGQGKFNITHAKQWRRDGVTYYNDIEIEYNNIIDRFSDFSVGSKTYIYYIDSVTFSDKTYYSVIALPSGLYYNKDYGVFHFKEAITNKNWTLLNK